MRLLGAFRGGGTEQLGQPAAKIDGCSRQNPAYRRSRKTAGKRSVRFPAGFF